VADLSEKRDQEARVDPSPLRSDPVERVKSMLDRWVSRTAEHLVLAMIKRGEPGVVVVPSDEYEGYMHTLEIMDDPEAKAALAEGERDEREGRLRPYEDVRRDLGIV
jgi:PHD/YefM family antitoxin component YafN of YafNO toxin-antitoxin module